MNWFNIICNYTESFVHNHAHVTFTDMTPRGKVALLHFATQVLPTIFIIHFHQAADVQHRVERKFVKIAYSSITFFLYPCQTSQKYWEKISGKTSLLTLH